MNKGQALVRVDPTQLQSSQEAQWAATQGSLNDVANARNAVAFFFNPSFGKRDEDFDVYAKILAEMIEFLYLRRR